MSAADLTRPVRDALVHLHDLPYLQTHSLATANGLAGTAAAGRALHRRLLEAIEALAPVEGTDPHSHAWRGYRILRLRYVEALDVEAVRQRLALSHGEYYRDHALALAAVTSVLNSSRDQADGAARHSPARRQAAIGSPLTSFVGREPDVDEITARLASVRLLTITGPPGTGKTRLALEVARTLSFTDGVYFVPLAPITDPRLVLSAVAEALGLRETGARTTIDLLRSALRTADALLVLDNFEQVLGAAPDVTALLESCPGLRVLVTSRAPLRAPGEHELPLAPLSLPRAGDDAEPVLRAAPTIQLFLDRALAVRPDLRRDLTALRHVAEICRRLDGLPLAIELAAARVRVLTLPEIESRLARRLDLLGGGRGLRESIAWSYALLEPDGQAALRQLSVFVGGFTLEAAEAVADLGGAALEQVDRLVEASLVVAEDVGGAMRFRLLETIREYALEQLASSGEANDARQLHADYFVALAQGDQVDDGLGRTSAQIDRLERERANLRAALEYFHERGDARMALRLTSLMRWLWLARGPFAEAIVELERALAMPSTDDASSERVRALSSLGRIRRRQGAFEEARRLFDEALTIANSGAEPLLRDLIHHDLGHTLLELGEMERGRSLLDATVTAATERGAPRLRAIARPSLGNAAFLAGNLDEAEMHFLDGLAAGIEADFALGRYMAHRGLGAIALERGQLDAAHEHLRECLRLAWDVGDGAMVAHGLEELAFLAVVRGDPRKALRVAGAAEAQRERFGAPLPPTFIARYVRYVDRARAALDVGEAESALARGRAEALSDAVAYALGEVG